jgi:hypothetical protein
VLEPDGDLPAFERVNDLIDRRIDQAEVAGDRVPAHHESHRPHITAAPSSLLHASAPGIANRPIFNELSLLFFSCSLEHLP